jgi:hypothetical protein
VNVQKGSPKNNIVGMVENTAEKVLEKTVEKTVEK